MRDGLKVSRHAKSRRCCAGYYNFNFRRCSTAQTLPDAESYARGHLLRDAGDVRIDRFIREHATSFPGTRGPDPARSVLPESLQPGDLSLLLAAGHTGFVHGRLMDLVLDAIKTGHQQGNRYVVSPGKRASMTCFREETTGIRIDADGYAQSKPTLPVLHARTNACELVVGLPGVNRFSVLDYAAM